MRLPHAHARLHVHVGFAGVLLQMSRRWRHGLATRVLMRLVIIVARIRFWMRLMGVMAATVLLTELGKIGLALQLG